MISWKGSSRSQLCNLREGVKLDHEDGFGHVHGTGASLAAWLEFPLISISCCSQGNTPSPSANTESLWIGSDYRGLRISGKHYDTMISKVDKKQDLSSAPLLGRSWPPTLRTMALKYSKIPRPPCYLLSPGLVAVQLHTVMPPAGSTNPLPHD